MAISIQEAESMLNTSKRMGVKLMIGQCCRYGKKYLKLKEIIDSEKYGKVIRADFHRISPLPIWSWENWFLDEKKSGGAALDLHVHDVDLINFIFGKPKSVMSFATNEKTKHDSVVSRYEYNDKLVTCTCDWGCPSHSYPFKLGFFIRMEKAVLETRDCLMLYTDEGEKIKVDFESINEYAAEVIDFIECIADNKESAVNPPEASLISCKIALCEKESADKGEKVTL
jgi:predicted dehydrogenase